jgi:hypothetical protein
VDEEISAQYDVVEDELRKLTEMMRARSPKDPEDEQYDERDHIPATFAHWAAVVSYVRFDDADNLANQLFVFSGKSSDQIVTLGLFTNAVSYVEL